MRGLSDTEKSILKKTNQYVVSHYNNYLVFLDKYESNRSLVICAIMQSLGSDSHLNYMLADVSYPIQNFQIHTHISQEELRQLSKFLTLELADLLLLECQNKYHRHECLQPILNRISELSRILDDYVASSREKDEREKEFPSNLPAIVHRVGGAVEKVVGEIDSYTDERFPLDRANQVMLARFISQNPHLNNIKDIDAIVNCLTYHGMGGIHRNSFLNLILKHSPEDVQIVIEYLYDIGIRDRGASDAYEFANSIELIELILELIQLMRKGELVEGNTDFDWNEFGEFKRQILSSVEDLELIVLNADSEQKFTCSRCFLQYRMNLLFKMSSNSDKVCIDCASN